jgi:hypothetical protein
MALQITYEPPVAKPINGMVPPGGFHYFQGDVKITGENLGDLYRAVMAHRNQNEIPSANTVEDVNNYLCGQWPDFCHNVDMVSVQLIPQSINVKQLLDDIQTWAKNILSSQSPHPLVGDELAETRSQICGRCPNNVNWRGGCGSCVVATDRLSASVRQARETASSSVLGGCNILRHDNRSAVFMQPEDLAKSSDLPSYCWLNK